MKKQNKETVIEMKEEIFSKPEIMEEMVVQFPHIAQNIFKNLDLTDLNNCLLVSKKWYNFIKNEKNLCIKMIQNIREVYKQSNGDQWNTVLKTAKIETLQKLLKATQEFFDNTKVENQWSPLHIAADYGNFDLCKFILNQGIALAQGIF